MSNSPVVSRLNEIQARIAKGLKPLGFTKKGRTFRRETDQRVLQIIALEAGRFEIGPPLPAAVSYLRPNLYGKFTIELGVYVPEIYERTNPPINSAKTITAAHCGIRTRLSHITEGDDIWWSISEMDDDEVDDLTALILAVGIPFLDRFRTRDAIIRDWVFYNDGASPLTLVARLDVAMILVGKGEKARALELFNAHLRISKSEGDEPFRKNHRRYVRELAGKLGLGSPG